MKTFKNIKGGDLQGQMKHNAPDIPNPKAPEDSFVRIVAKGKIAKTLRKALTRKQSIPSNPKSLDTIDWEEHQER